MNLLIVGNGYLGKAIVKEFIAGKWQVQVVSQSDGENSISCDISDRMAVSTLPTADFIIHCAATSGGDADNYKNLYVNGCSHLAEKFPKIPMLFISSTSVYGQVDGCTVTESSDTFPARETGNLLLDAEKIVLAGDGIVARLTGIYGPGRSMLLQKFIADEARIEEPGTRYLNHIHRDDAARAVFHLANNYALFPGEIFNVADSTPLQQQHCYIKLSELLHRPLPPSGPRNINSKRGWSNKQVSNAKLLQTGWQPQYASFLDALPSLLFEMSMVLKKVET